MNKLYEVLEICLQEIEQGADIDTVLFRYPDFADELRPILEASVNAKSMAAATPSADVARRNRAKVLQHAAQMRESKVRSSRRIWFASLRRVAVTLAVVTALFVSGTGLVRAASTTVPGDNLYPVKRTWEDVLLLFTFNLQQREALEIEHENERLHELRELFAEGRDDEDVDFAGLVTSQDGDQWIVGGIPVVVSPQTEIRDQGQGIVVGSAVRVEGHTQDNGAVLAEEIKLLPPDAKLPNLDDDHGEKEDHEGESRRDNSGKGSDDDEPKFEETRESDSDSEKDDSSSDDSNSGKGDSGSDDDSDEDESDNSGSGGGSDDDDDSGGDDSDSGGDDDDD